MQTKVSRIILDTNLWISFLIMKDFSKLDELILFRQNILVFSQELITEFIEVAERVKFRKNFSHEDIRSVVEVIGEYADLVTVQAEVNICRDPKDNFLLALSIDGQADFLITGDKDLLALKIFGETEIVAITEFLAK